MKQKQFNRIIKSTSDVFSQNKPLQKLCELYPKVKQDTISSIYSQEMQRRVKKLFHKLSQPSVAKEYYEYYNESVKSGEPPGVLLKMARELEFSPAMLAKILLEYNLKSQSEGATVSKSQVNKLLRDTTKIQDRDLSYEVYLCLLDDDVYGPFTDSIKQSIGYEYELILRHELDSLNISYLDEDILRTRGYDKTPDIKLDVPIAVDGHVINWIESKASFGDEESHKVYLRDQFWSYWNRFGPGLVIYWFGFIDELDELTEKGILLRDKFPLNITFMDPSLISDKS